MYGLSRGRLTVAAGIVLGLAGCAGTPPASLVQARGDVNNAMTSPPGTYSQVELNDAHQKLSQAEHAARDDNMDSANRLAQESLADLRLARAQAEAEHEQQAASALQATVGSLRNEATTHALQPPPPEAGAPATAVPPATR